MARQEVSPIHTRWHRSPLASDSPGLLDQASGSPSSPAYSLIAFMQPENKIFPLK